MASSYLKVPSYDEYPSGFFYLYGRRKFLGFCEDVEDCNRLLLVRRSISRQEREALFIQMAEYLHREWCSDVTKGGGLPKAKRDDFLVKALKMVC